MAQFIVLAVFMLLVAGLVIGFVAGSAAALWRWRGGWRLAAGLPLLGVIVVVARIVVDTSADPTAHNLWPFELLGAVVIAGAALGSIQLVRRSLICAVLLTLVLGSALAAPPASAQSQRCFNETGYCISGNIRTYWERNGGLAVFDYPISALQVEMVEGSWTGSVQWFERDRLEDHNDQGLGVLAGRLGARYLELQGRPWSQGNQGPQPARNLCMHFSQIGYNVCAPQK